MALTPEQQTRLAAALREGESPLWQGCGGAAAAAPKPGLFVRLFGKPSFVGELSLYAITAKRVLVLPPQGEVQEWFLMLGLIQEVNERPDGSGDIVFDYVEENGRRTPRGLIGIPQVQVVKNLLASAIDAAYNASPWSV
ncbi:MAG: hypothetical protein IKW48_09240 [Akkermansia sp.]|nr:hypothetical protein [Akkermansia sp.]